MLQKVKENIDPKIVVSTVAGGLIIGVIGYAMMKSGIKPLKDVASAIK